MHQECLNPSDAVFLLSCWKPHHNGMHPGICEGWAVRMQPQSGLSVCEPRASASVYLALVCSRDSETCKLVFLLWHLGIWIRKPCCG